MKNYVLLGVPPLASPTQLHEGYRRIALENHPDKGGDTGKFADITLAYSVMKNPRSRKKYDDELKLLKKWVVCKKCKGSGTTSQMSTFVKAALNVPCKVCGGSGV